MLGYITSSRSCACTTTSRIWRWRTHVLSWAGRRSLSAVTTATAGVEANIAISKVNDDACQSLHPSYQRILHAAIAGLPNAGKSTLVNCMVGDKVSAVSSKRHTTRENMLGILTVANSQIFFHDTPGFVSHKDQREYQRELSLAARNAIDLVDLTLLVVDASKPLAGHRLVSLNGLLERALRSSGEVALVLNKVDLVNPKPRLLKRTDELMKKAQDIMNAIDAERDAAEKVAGNFGAWTDATAEDVVDGPAGQEARNVSARTSGMDVGSVTGGATRRNANVVVGQSGGSFPAAGVSNAAQLQSRDIEGKEGVRKLGAANVATTKRYRDLGPVDAHVEVFMVSAKSGDGVDDIVEFLARRARPGRWRFGREKTTNVDKQRRATEIIRESLYVHLYKELPYIIKQSTRKFRRYKDNSVYLDQNLRVERESQKGIVVAKLRYIHVDVEKELTKLFGTRVRVHFNVLASKNSTVG